MERVIVTDIFNRKSFDIISVLNTKYPDLNLVLGIPVKSFINFLFPKFIYKGNYHILRTDDFSSFEYDILKISEFYREDKLVFLPVEEDSTSLFLRFIKKNGTKNFSFLLPCLSDFEDLRNKGKLIDKCSELNIPVPPNFTLQEVLGEDFSDFPLIIKPKVGSGGRGNMRAYNPAEIRNIYDKIRINGAENYLLQKLLPDGEHVLGYFSLSINGNVVNHYCHRRIRTSPSTGGVTVLSELVENKELEKLGSGVIKKFGVSGLIMLEFIYDKQADKYYLIECNPRLWGSVILSEYSEANLLINYINLCLEREPINKQKKSDLFIRWFFPRDIIYYVKSGFRIKGFWRFRDTCFINCTYSNPVKVLFFYVFYFIKSL